MKKILNLSIILTSSFLITGCITNPSKPAEGIKLEVTKVVTELVTLPENIFENCRKPKTVNESFPNLKINKKATEADLLMAYADSHANEINCYNTQREAILLQRELIEIHKKAENAKNDK